MRKILKGIIILIIVLGLSSCGIFEKGFDPHNADRDTNRKLRKMTKNSLLEIVTCLDKHDKESIIDMFSPKIANTYPLNRQIDKVFEIYNSKFVSYGNVTAYESTYSVADGIYSELSYDGIMYDIELENGDKFNLTVGIYYVYDNIPEMVGVAQIRLEDEHGKILAIIGKDNKW